MRWLLGFRRESSAKPPVFPKKLSDEEKVAMFRKIVEEMLHFFVGSGLI